MEDIGLFSADLSLFAQCINQITRKCWILILELVYIFLLRMTKYN